MANPKSNLDKTDVWCIVRMVLIGVLGWNSRAEAGAYMDFGVGYMKGIEITKSASVTFDDYTISAEAKLEAPQDTGHFMFRGGYKHKGWHLEYETKGIPGLHIDSVNLYHRWEF